MNGFGSPLDKYLDPGEKLLWSGQPKQGVLLQASDALMIPFSLMWGGFAFFWEAGVLGLIPLSNHGTHPTHQVPIFMAIWGIPFVLVGVYMIIGRFFFDAASRSKTWYGVTDQRLIILKSIFTRNVNSFDYGNLTNLNLVERGDHSGDILFGLPAAPTAFAGRSNRVPQTPGFYLLPDARNVYNRIRAIQQQARK